MEANIKMITIHGAVCVGEEPTEANIKMITIDGAVSVGEEGIERGREGQTA